MRFHVVSLPHTQLTDDFSLCAYTMKVKNFALMMMTLGHEVHVYGGQTPMAGVTHYHVCFTETSRLQMLAGKHYVDGGFTADDRYWTAFHTMVISRMRQVIQPTDFICVISGRKAEMVANAFPNNATVEFGVGYSGCFAQFRIFESYAWMHANYGAWAGDAMSADGRWYDDVINGYYDPNQFLTRFEAHRRYAKLVQDEPSLAVLKDSLLFLGRPVERKGSHIAIQVAKAAGLRITIAGQHSLTLEQRRAARREGIYYTGPVNPGERAILLGICRALIAPTIYVEPFGNAVIEAMATGTPVITSDWGAFTETVAQGFTGYRCRMLQEFVAATKKVRSLDSDLIRKYAEDNFSLSVIARKYEAYFARLMTMYGKGWSDSYGYHPSDSSNLFGTVDSTGSGRLRERPGAEQPNL